MGWWIICFFFLVGREIVIWKNRDALFGFYIEFSRVSLERVGGGGLRGWGGGCFFVFREVE